MAPIAYAAAVGCDDMVRDLLQALPAQQVGCVQLGCQHLDCMCRPQAEFAASSSTCPTHTDPSLQSLRAAEGGLGAPSRLRGEVSGALPAHQQRAGQDGRVVDWANDASSESAV